MATTLTPCRVPWAISPTDSEVTLVHSETMSGPLCKVAFGAGRLSDNDRTESRTIEIDFEDCYFVRTGPHRDYEDIRVLGYIVRQDFEENVEDYLAWRHVQWRNSGFCPDSGFFVAQQSDWLESVRVESGFNGHHYVVDGRDGYVELIAAKYHWREWLGTHMPKFDYHNRGPCVASGEGVE